MPETNIHNTYSQFKVEHGYFLKSLDIVNWYRFFFILKEVLRLHPKNILEIGEGCGVIRRIIAPECERYDTIDINAKLKPTHICDVRTYKQELMEMYDCIIAADILEHIPFVDLKNALNNLFAYLRPKGTALITIPHRASYFLWMTPHYIPHIVRVPTGFLSIGAFYRRFVKRKIWIDPDHEWEIGDGYHSIHDVESIMQSVGFKIEKRQTLLYVDFWVLKKSLDSQ